MTSATVAGTGTTLAYDPLMRLYQTASGSTTSRFAYDGLDAIAEYNASGTLQRRWVFDPTTGQPLVQFEGAGTGSTSRRYLSADQLGSIVSVSDSNGIGLAINKYDEFGIPSLTTYSGRYGYTGQAWIGSAQLWHYKARAYHPRLGRFLQPDPIGYWDSPNLYAYVLNDPVNLVDPLGLCIANGGGPGVSTPENAFENCGDVIVTGERSLVWLADLGFGDFIFKGGNLGFELIELLVGDAGGDDDGRDQKQCKSPPGTPAERDAARRGNRGTFWASRFKRGDPFGAIGLSMVTNSSLAAQWANMRLRDAISTRSPGMSPSAVSSEVQLIGVQLMQAHITPASGGSCSRTRSAIGTAPTSMPMCWATRSTSPIRWGCASRMGVGQE